MEGINNLGYVSELGNLTKPKLNENTHCDTWTFEWWIYAP